ncbi:hypothetical protein SAMN04488074_1492 [Lentzea albidocapillata subsp. violacea]|uniref:Osmotically inducible protein C n=1 Tax=Lentzea albidocapillata subsp. violacea TaxID=128104 RepID=A0A1H0AK78_9PSEU|nr:hypothetical protein [Lentzea albidocapillata]SDN33960.1 hypothetical protein SAMN04488074_1492 [Lentzea albidocapillata subsp. violacea]
MPGQSHRIEFTGPQGEPLAARLDLPESAPRAYAVFVHCFACSKDTLAAGLDLASSDRLRIAVLRFDFTGLGACGGDFANRHLADRGRDVRVALATPAAPLGAVTAHQLGILARTGLPITTGLSFVDQSDVLI